MAEMAALRLFGKDCLCGVGLPGSATADRMTAAAVLVLKTMLFLFYLELSHSAENKHGLILQKMMVFTSLFWI